MVSVMISALGSMASMAAQTSAAAKEIERLRQMQFLVGLQVVDHRPAAGVRMKHAFAPHAPLSPLSKEPAPALANCRNCGAPRMSDGCHYCGTGFAL